MAATRLTSKIKTHTSGTMNVLDSGARQKFSTGAQRDIEEGKGRMDLLPFHAIIELAKLYEAGAKKYGDGNWRLGMPLSRYLNSALRHLFKFAMGMRDEPHEVQAIWNLCSLIETRRLIDMGALPKKLNDLKRFDQLAETLASLAEIKEEVSHFRQAVEDLKQQAEGKKARRLPRKKGKQ
jgi:hypothetical protein